MHKIPASVGLGTFLAKNVEKSKALVHLLAFTLASPIANVATFVALKFLLIDDLKYWIGVLLMISSGTFLYVATMHILPESMTNRESLCQLTLAILGMVSPYLLH
jgi:zinc transporter 9